MPKATDEFFLSLEPRGRIPRLRATHGTIRFDLRNEATVDQWLITFDNGRVRVSRNARQPVDTVITTDADAFERLARGEENLWALLVRGQLIIQGNRPLVMAFRQLMPQPPGNQGPRLRRRNQP